MKEDKELRPYTIVTAVAWIVTAAVMIADQPVNKTGMEQEHAEFDRSPVEARIDFDKDVQKRSEKAVLGEKRLFADLPAIVEAKEPEAHRNNSEQTAMLTAAGGVFAGPSGRETWYNLPMSGVISGMRSLGYTEEDYPYWIRDDGCKMLGDYIMIAASYDIRPKGTIVETSRGFGIVCDTGGFAQHNQTQVDLAVSW